MIRVYKVHFMFTMAIVMIVLPICRSEVSKTAIDPAHDVYEVGAGPLEDIFSMQFAKFVLSTAPNQNVVLSPFSVKLVLAVLLEASGINSTTQQELSSTQNDLPLQQIRSLYRDSTDSLKNMGLVLDTKLYVDASFEPQQKFVATIAYWYHALVEKLHFRDVKGSVTAINEWAANATMGRLQQLVNEENIKNSAMLLTNVIFFEGQWRYTFTNSFEGAFLTTAAEQKRTELMQQTGYFYYAHSAQLKAKVLRLPYVAGLSMFIILPDDNFGLDKLLQSLDVRQLRAAQRSLRKVNVRITVPKFRFEYSNHLNDTLVSLGVREIFKATTSLPGLSRGAGVAGQVKVSNIIQKAGISVDEHGTVAYAATVVEIENKFGGDPTLEEFNANHAFLFIIQEESTSHIFFAGKVHEPVF